MRRKMIGIAGVMVAVLTLSQCAGPEPDTELSEQAFRAFAAELEARIAPLTREQALANFEASISGREEDYAHSADAQLALKTAYSDRAAFARLKAWREAGTVTEPLLARQLVVFYNAFLESQLADETLQALVSRGSDIEKRFNTHRATIDGTQYTDNELSSILRNSTDLAKLEKAWLASKVIGQTLAFDIVELVKLRNSAAQSLGFANFQVMQLALSEQDPTEIEALFDELDRLTREDFVKAKTEIDNHLAGRLGVAVQELCPWHYQNPFFQEAPTIYPVDLDGYYADTDLVQLTEDFFAGIGLPVDDLVARSDLFGKPGKYQHAFCEDIDRAGDVRVLCSIEPNAYWMNTVLHEFGHAVYSKFNDPELPWVLRDSAHAFTTEAIANMFGRLASDPDWMHQMVGISAEESGRIRDAAGASLRLEQLVFSRWSQVMFRFEKALYEDPDQDLNALWWELVERYQLLTRPEGRDQPDWAAKIHVALYPAYYHNYLMGELLASQLHDHIVGQVLDGGSGSSYVGRAEVGIFLREKVFEPGRSLPWNQMIEAATGEPLNPAHYAGQFVRGS